MSNPFDAVRFCTPEDLLIESSGDLAYLVTAGQILSSGSDGFIAAGDWTLSSATTNFASQGVSAYDVCIIAAPSSVAANTIIAETLGKKVGRHLAGGTFFVVDVPSTTLLLRVADMESSQGESPSGDNDLSGVLFLVPSFSGVIRTTSDRIRRDLNFALDADIVTSEDIRQLCVYGVLANRYFAAARSMGDERDDFVAKAKKYQDLYTGLTKELMKRSRSGTAVDFIPVVP